MSGVVNSTTDINKIVNAMKDNVGAVNTLIASFNTYIQQISNINNELNSSRYDIKALTNNTTSVFNSFISIVTKIASFDVKKFKDFTKTKKIIQDLTTGVSDVLNTISDTIIRMMSNISSDKYNDILNSLATRNIEKTITSSTKDDNTNSSLVTTEKTQQAGLLDVIASILNVYSTLGGAKSLGFLKKMKFKHTFDIILKDFSWMVSKISGIANFGDMDNVYKSVTTVEKLALRLPNIMKNLGSGFLNNIKTIKKNKSVLKYSFNMWIGEKENDLSIMNVISKIFKKLCHDDIASNITYATKNSKSIETVFNSLQLVTKSLALIGMMILPLKLGYIVLVGGKHSLCDVLRVALRKLSRLNEKQELTNTMKNLLMVSVAITSISAAIAMLALTGVFALKSWPVLLVTMAAIPLYLCLMFKIFGSRFFQNDILVGTASILKISLAITLLGLTTVLLVTLGSFVTASWAQILQVGALLVVLVGAFIGISFASSLIAEANKSLLMISLNVAIIGLTAVLLVAIANHVAFSWNAVYVLLTGIISIALVMAALTAMTHFIKTAEILKIALAIAILCASMLALAAVSRLIPESNFKIIAGLTALMCGVAWAVSKLLSTVGNLTINPSFWLGVAAIGIVVGILIALVTPIKIIADSISKVFNVIKTIKDNESKYGDSKELVKLLSIPFDIIMAIVTKVGKYNIRYKQVATFRRLDNIVSRIGKIATTVKDIAILRIPTAFDKSGKPTQWEKMQQSHFEHAKHNISSLIDVFVNTSGSSKSSILSQIVSIDKETTIKRKHIRAFRRLNNIVGSVGNLAKVVQDIALFRMPVEFDSKTGKPTKWEKMDETTFRTATANIAMLITTVVDAVGSNKDMLKNIKRRKAKVLGIVMDSISGIKDVVQILAMIQKGEVPLKIENNDGKTTISGSVRFSEIISNKKTIEKDLSSLLSIPLTVLNSITTKTNSKHKAKTVKNVTDALAATTKQIVELYNNSLKGLDTDRLSSAYSSTQHVLNTLITQFSGKSFDTTSANNFKNQANSLIEVLKTTNNTDVTKLKYVYSLVSKLNEFSRSISGNFDKLAECINENLITALEELNNNLSGINTQNSLNNINRSASTVSMLPDKSAAAKSNTVDKTSSNEAALRLEIQRLKGQIEALSAQQKPQKIKTDSNGVVLVKMTE